MATTDFVLLVRCLFALWKNREIICILIVKNDLWSQTKNDAEPKAIIYVRAQENSDQMSDFHCKVE